jgi:aminopeptidase N
LNEDERSLTGEASLVIVPLDSGFNQCEFHAVEMDVEKVSLIPNGNIAYHADSSKIYIEFNEQYTPEDTLTLVVRYYTKPEKGVYFNIPTMQGENRPFQIYTHSEPTDARYWFPCYDAPDDKLTSEMKVTVNDGLSVVSNGSLVDVQRHVRDSLITYHWLQDKPHVNYLISFAAGDFHVVSDSYGDVPVNYHVYPDNYMNAEYCFGKTPEMMSLFSTLFGYPYPWCKYDQVLIRNYPARGMEHTSATTLTDAIMHDGRMHLDKNCDNLVAHELAHQWFGNLVTCENWPHIWLNEGFATYAEILFTQADQGDDAADYALYLQKNAYFRFEGDEFKQPIVYTYYTHPREMFSHVTYQKASLVLHMLRDMIGDATFFESLKRYLSQFAFQSVSTIDFIAIVEWVCSRELNWFFDQWLYKGGYPVLAVAHEYDETERSVVLDIVQKQEPLDQVYKLPLMVELVTADAHTRHLLNIDSRKQTIRLPAPANPLAVRIDPDHALLKTLEYKRDIEQLLFELRNDDHVAGRMEAIDSLQYQTGDTASVVRGLIHALHYDNFWAVRRKAAHALGHYKSESSKIALVKGCADGKSRVRRASVYALENFDDPGLFRLFREIAQSDSSYYVQSAALYAMTNLPDSLSFEMLEPFFSIKSGNGIVESAALSALGQLNDSRCLPIAYHFARNPDATFFQRYSALKIIEDNGHGDSETGDVLVRLLRTMENEKLLHKVIQILSNYRTEQVARALEKKLHDDISDATRRRLRYSLSQIESAPLKK